MGKVIDFIKSNIKIVILIAILFVFVVTIIVKAGLQQRTTYTVVNGEIENSVETNLYVIKDEKVVDYDKSQALIALVEQGKRASKNEPIATYQNDSYEDYQSQIEQIDKQIQTLVKDLPATYSADISGIENKILYYSNQVQGTTSYLKMQEYKSKLDELAYKKITILANSSPDSSAIRDLVEQRKKLDTLGRSSDNSIWAPISGIVTFKVDSLEGTYEYKAIESSGTSKLDDIISSYDSKTNNKFGIKVVNNFGAYLLIKTPTGDNDQYIVEGKNYNIRIADLENKKIKARLEKNITENGYNYSLFKIDNEIDSLVDYRKLSCEVIWNSVEGMAVPLNSIHEDEENHYKYVLMVYGAEYVKVPINVITQSDSIALIENATRDTFSRYGLDEKFKLELYDELVIGEN